MENTLIEEVKQINPHSRSGRKKIIGKQPQMVNQKTQSIFKILRTKY